MKPRKSIAADVILGLIVIIVAVLYGLLFKLMGGIP